MYTFETLKETAGIQYKSDLTLLETETAVEEVKHFFQQQLKQELNLVKVSAPILIEKGTGINDNLNGVEAPVSVSVPALDTTAEIVQSLAKWKRLRLQQLSIPEGKGLVTDMRALRPDEVPGKLHSIYVDQFDWEKHISKANRSLAFLKQTVRSIYKALVETEKYITSQFPVLSCSLPDEIYFIHAEELLERYPTLTVKERETEIAKEYGAVFIIGIGGALQDSTIHDGRAPDYDDWSTETEHGFKGLNGDIIVWHPVLQQAFEISSMGIRVDEEALLRQLKIRGCEERKDLMFHQLLLKGELPQSIGGGIGQSRLCMFMLKKAHIGEVQVGLWDEKTRTDCAKQGIELM